MNNSYNFSMRNPVLQTVNPAYTNPTNPNTTRLTLEQQYNQLAQQMLPNQSLSDPYSDYISVLGSCTDVTRGKIVQDARYIDVYGQCENIIKQTLYARMIPEVLSTQQGRVLFEQLNATTKTLKDEYTQKELQREKEAEERELKALERERRLDEKEKQLDILLNEMNSKSNSPIKNQDKQNDKSSNTEKGSSK